ncbi:MAG: hypothetical protein KA369_15095 [Spirochaetes bacterium]|nr:hypothetical protein [Spirochaetota bacterium]
MEIQTTINMSKRTMDELNQASITLQLSRTNIIRLLIKQFLEDQNEVEILKSPVKYQERDSVSQWAKFHITLREDEYELCLDLRKVYKMSLSLIIALAISKYLKNIHFLINHKSTEEITDNYLFHNYYFSFNLKNGVRKIQIYWGFTNPEIILTDNYPNII